MGEKYKKTCKYLNYVEHLVMLASTVTDCASSSAFSSLVCVHVTSSVIGIKICAVTAGIKKFKSIIKKKKKKDDKIVLLGKAKLNTIEFLISKALSLIRMKYFCNFKVWNGFPWTHKKKC